MEIISTHLILITMEVVINNTFKSYLSQFLQSDWSLLGFFSPLKKPKGASPN